MHAQLPLKHSTQLPELALFSKASPLLMPTACPPKASSVVGLLLNQFRMSVSDWWDLNHMPVSSCEESWET